jgi:glucosamine--fructose-6-phosphate aminotransferase (isomerizing)
MCGIIGVLGQHEVSPLLVEGLKRLEYRGYDSAGIATLSNGTLDRRRAVGKLVELSDLLVHNPLQGKIGIGHTRWATHGAPTVENAHPHTARDVAIVHNGIIENYKELRTELAEAGLTTTTETDTETVVLLTQHYLNQRQSPVDAARTAVSRLEGAYALAFIFQGYEDLMVVTRKGSPLAIGYGENEMFTGSDAMVLAPLTDQITYLEEGDFAVLTRQSVEIYDSTGTLANREKRAIRASAAHYDKDGHKHFMAKEIAEQPRVIAETFKNYVNSAGTGIDLSQGNIDFSKIDQLTMVGCGTAYLACFTAKYWFERIARLPVELDIASEFRYRDPIIRPRTASLFVSQSGETADTLAALRYCKSQNADSILSLTNVPESSIARESDVPLQIYAGAEIGVASTKAFTCQLTALLLLALKAGVDRGTLTPDELARHLEALRSLPASISHALDLSEALKKVSLHLADARDILYLGRGQMYPLAHEGALKLKEISYIHAEAYASGELKHGPIALIDDKVPVVVMAPRDALFEKSISNMQEVIARKGKVILISDANGVAEAGSDCWKTVTMPQVADILNPILYAIPAQLLAYQTAVAKGTDVDQPRNLAKSVTVE